MFGSDGENFRIYACWFRQVSDEKREELAYIYITLTYSQCNNIVRVIFKKKIRSWAGET